MGEYSGDGIVTGGGESIRPLSSLSFRDSNGVLQYLFVEQKEKQKTTIFPGVKIGPAQDATSSSDLSELALDFTWHSTSGASGGQVWVIPSCKGNKTDVRYSQINGSNLYELDQTYTQLWERHKVSTGGWTGWVGG